MAERTIDQNTPCFQVQVGYTEIGGRAFMRTLGDALVASDRIVRIEHFPLPPWGETPEGE